MGPMVRGKRLDRRKIMKLSVLGVVMMFTWSFVAAPHSVGQEEVVPEPEELLAYSTFAEAAPVSNYLDHKSPLPAPAFGIALAHSLTEINQPSQASGLAWLTDFGIANGLHGTTTGSAVPTEATARQPGGSAAAEYKAAGGPVGEDEFGRVAAGWARATATQAGAPRGFAHAFIGNAVLFPAAGTPPEAPGTYDPDGTFPGGPGLAPTPDPGPRNQMAILSIGSIASTSESVRNGETVTSIGVAELQGINIGNRTSDGRCTNCFTIDALRVETFAATNGEGSRAAYRVMLGRACRRTLVTAPTPVVGEEDETLPREEDQCLQPGDPRAEYTLKEIDQIEGVNEFFAEPLVLSGVTCPGTNLPCTIAIRVSAGKVGHADPRRPERTVNPPDSACRNYAYPDPEAKEPVAECEALPEYLRPQTGPDKDDGQVARAVGEGIDIEILTLTGTQFIPQRADLERCFGLFEELAEEGPDLPDDLPPELSQALALAACPVAGLRAVRELNVTLGVSQASAVARPNVILPPTDTGGGDGGLGGVIPPPIGDGGLGGGIVPPVDTGGGQTIVGGGGLGAGAYRLKIDWSSFKIKPLPAGDLAKALLAGGIVGGMVLLIRRRLRFAEG